MRCYLMLIVAISFSAESWGDVVDSDKSGFQIKVQSKSSATAEDVFRAIAKDIAKWWDPYHTFSGDAKNLMVDMERQCLFEALPNGGFVRHLELVHVDTNKRIGFTGGLGPLQQMGVGGALTITLDQSEGGTKITLTYNVSGYSADGLDRIAPAVDRVLSEQIDRLKRFVESKK